ncbi:hypothetical protein ACQY0O_003845 [Thecaphora frezii]
MSESAIAAYDVESKDSAVLATPGTEAAPAVPALATLRVEPSNPLFRLYCKPVTQVALVGLVCFLCPGMFNAISGIGGGGQVSPDASNKSSLALYAVFAGVSFFAGTIHNRLGSRWTLCLGALGYCLYIASFLSYNINGSEGFVIAAGAILGFCASLLWVAQGSLMLSYPTEQQKGTFISVFWIIFNLGAVLGSAIQLGLTYNSTGNTVSNGVYIGFIVLTGLGAFVSMLLRDPAKMIRDDGTRVTVPKQTTWQQEFRGLFALLVSDPWIVLLFPLFFASNFFYTWQFQDFNGPLFTLRTRSLNNLLYWLAQMAASMAMGRLLDNKRMSRRSRAWLGWSIIFALVWAVWGGSYAKQVGYTRADTQQPWWDAQRVDFTQSRRYAGLCILYILSGVQDALFQTMAYWLIGSVSNDLSKLGFLAGFYKSIQSAGAAVAFSMDAGHEKFMMTLAVSWALCAVGLVFALPVLALRVTNRTIEEDAAGAVDADAAGAVDADAAVETPVSEKA